MRKLATNAADSSPPPVPARRHAAHPVPTPSLLKQFVEAFSGPSATGAAEPGVDVTARLTQRRAAFTAIDAALAASSAFGMALFVINIDHLSVVNDRFGHAGGDAVVTETASRLRAAAGFDAIIARLDNGEFLVVLPNRDLLAMEQLIERIQAAASTPLQLGDHAYRLSLSIGAARAPDHGDTADVLVRNACHALRRCKRQHRGEYELYAPAISIAEERTASIELALPGALDNGDLSVHYQPIVRSTTRRTAAYEALLRWHDPVLGDISPLEFIPIAENMGLIRRLGTFVLGEACAFIAHASRPSAAVAVNVSSSQLLDEAFPITVAETLQRHNLDGDRLLLEITETVAMQADSGISQVFDELAALGVRLFIDDFGMGFSNLVRLKDLPVAGIKIDREFVRGLPQSETDTAIFRAAHAIAKALRLVIVVEGIETPEQEAFVQPFNVEFLQGFRFAPPAPATARRKQRVAG